MIYFSSRSIGLPIGPDTKTVEAWGGLDLVCAIEEILLVVIAAAVLARPGLLARPVRFRRQARSLASLLAAPVVVIAATTAVMTPAWAGSEGPAGMASGSSSSMASSPDSLQDGMGDMGSTNGLPDMRMYGNTNPPTAAQVEAAANLIKETDASLVRFENVHNAIAAGYTYRLATNGEEHLLYTGENPAYQGLNPKDPSSLVYAINLKGHAPILLGAMYLMGGSANGPQVGGGLTRWHSHLEVCRGNRIIVAGFNVALRGQCDPSTWKDTYTTQMLHVWVVPLPRRGLLRRPERRGDDHRRPRRARGDQARAAGAITPACGGAAGWRGRARPLCALDAFRTPRRDPFSGHCCIPLVDSGEACADRRLSLALPRTPCLTRTSASLTCS